jgi:hypothetical protein
MTETTKISEEQLGAIRKRAARPVELVDEFALRQAMDDRDTLLEALEALRQENEWISVSRMPEYLEDERVLLCVVEEFEDCDDVTHRHEVVSTGYVTFFPQGRMATTDYEGGEYEEKEIVGYRPLPTPPAPRTEEQP